eukprot:357308-Chlamydomonas_euryale.AAC.11
MRVPGLQSRRSSNDQTEALPKPDRPASRARAAPLTFRCRDRALLVLSVRRSGGRIGQLISLRRPSNELPWRQDARNNAALCRGAPPRGVCPRVAARLGCTVVRAGSSRAASGRGRRAGTGAARSTTSPVEG